MEQLNEKLRDNKIVLLVSETGSGKTTQIPQNLIDQGYTKNGKKVIVLQNRVAVATEVAKRVADEMGVKVGKEVGFVTGPEKNASKDSQVVFMTAGVFRNMIRRDPTLSEVSVVLFDEFDERNLLMDIGVSLLEKSQEGGECDTKFILMSATLNADKISGHFGGVPIIEAKGRPFPVEAHFQPTDVWEGDMATAAVEKVEQILTTSRNGHTLIFMPGKAEIEKVCKELRGRNLKGVEVVALYGEMPPDERQKAFAEYPGKRKIIVSTNIAERGVTFEGVTNVIDSGLARQKDYNPTNDTTKLGVIECAQDALIQRKGRAGRTAPGQYHALYSQEQFNRRPKETKAEILRTALREVVLQIKAMGYSREGDPLRFMDSPDKANWKAAKNQLRLMGALDPADETKLSEHGQQMAELGCDPRDGAMVLHGCELGVGEDAIIVAAIRTSRRLTNRPKGKEAEVDAVMAKYKISTQSDLPNLLALYRDAERNNFSYKWCRDNFVSPQALQEVRKNVDDFTRRAKQMNFETKNKTRSAEALGRAVLHGLPDKLYVREGGEWYRHGTTGERAQVARESAVHSEFIAASDVISIQTRRGPLPLITQATTADTAYIREFMPEICDAGSSRTAYDKSVDSVRRLTKVVLKGGTYSLGERGEAVEEQEAVEVFARALANGEVDLPCVGHNKLMLEQINKAYHRSGGRVVKPDLAAWYKERLGSVSSRKEAEAMDERLRISIDRFLTPELQKELDEFYPTTVRVGDKMVVLAYEYRPANPTAYSDSERVERFQVSGNLIQEDVAALTDPIPVGKGDRARLIEWRVAVGYQTYADTNPEKLKDKIDQARLEHEWSRWTRPESKEIALQPLDDLPSLEALSSLGVEPVEYAKDRNGKSALAYPALRYSQTYDYDQGRYKYTYQTDYFRTQGEARQIHESSKEVRAEEVGQEKRKLAREALLEPTRTRYAELDPQAQMIFSSYESFGLQYSEYSDLSSKWSNVRYALDSSDGDVEEAKKQLDEVEARFGQIAEERTRRMSLVGEVEARRLELAKRVEVITYDTYNDLGFTYEEYNALTSKWNEAKQALAVQDRYGKMRMPDPEKASALLSEVAVLAAERNHSPEQRRLRDILGGRDRGFAQLVRVEGGRVAEATTVVNPESTEQNPLKIPIGGSGRNLKVRGNKVTFHYASGSEGSSFTLPDGLFVISRDANDVLEVEKVEQGGVQGLSALGSISTDPYEPEPQPAERSYREEPPAPAYSTATNARTGLGSALADKLRGILGKKEEPAPEVPKPTPTPRPTAPTLEVRKEVMTDAVRQNLTFDLTVARDVLEGLRKDLPSVKTGGKLTDLEEKQVKLRKMVVDRLTDLKTIEGEIGKTDDVASARGKVGDIVKRAEKAAQEVARVLGGQAALLSRYRDILELIPVIEEEWGGKLSDEGMEKLVPKLMALAKRSDDVKTTLRKEIGETIAEEF